MFRWVGFRWGTYGLGIVAAVVLAAGLAACGDNPAGAGDEDEVVVGGLFSLTGNWSTLGQTGQAALELAVEDVNDYLEDAGSEMRFRAVVEDTRLDPDAVVARAQALRARGAQVVVGPQSSAEVAALKAYADDSDLLVVSPSSTAGSLALAGDNILRFTPADSLEGIAVSALMWDDGIRAVVPVWRADAGNQGLHRATRARFTALGGTVSDGFEYGASATNFAPVVAALRAQVEQAVAANGAAQTAVYLAGFDEVAALFGAATGDAVLEGVRWYGSDGVALSQALLDDATASAFAARVGYPNPIFGLGESTREAWEPVAARIAARAGLAPDAFALAVYDAVWVAAKAYVATGPSPSFETLKAQYVATASSHFGTTGWTILNAAGDRRYGDFDFWAIRPNGGGFRWERVAQYELQTGLLLR